MECRSQVLVETKIAHFNTSHCPEATGTNVYTCIYIHVAMTDSTYMYVHSYILGNSYGVHVCVKECGVYMYMHIQYMYVSSC